MKPWKRIEPTKVDKIGWRTIVTKTFAMPDGQTAEFQTLSREGAHCVATIALTPDGQVIVARQFRPGPEKVFDELPGGYADTGDADFAAAARRELAEETGYDAGTMEFLGDVYKSAYENTVWHFFLARGCTPRTGGQHLDDHEHVEVHLVSIGQLLENAQHGRMTDVGGVFLAYEQLMKYKEETA